MKRSRIRRASSLRTNPWALPRVAMVSAFASASPRMLTKTLACRRSMLSSTSVTETKPIRGSFISRWRIALTSILKSSRSRARRTLMTNSPHLDGVVQHDEVAVPVDRLGDVRQHLVGVPRIGADAGDGQARPPPGVVVRHLGRGHMKPMVEPVEERLQDPSFVLEAPRAGKAAFDAQDAHHHPPAGPRRDALPLDRLRLDGERLDDVSLFHVVVALETDAALVALGHFADVLLEPSQGPDRALVDHDPVANQAHPGAPDHPPRRDVGSRDRPHAADRVDLAHFRTPQHHFDHLRREEPAGELLDVVEDFVDDPVEADIHPVGLRQTPDLGLRSDIEPDHPREAGCGEHDVPLRDLATGRVQDRYDDLTDPEVLQD